MLYVGAIVRVFLLEHSDIKLHSFIGNQTTGRIQYNYIEKYHSRRYKCGNGSYIKKLVISNNSFSLLNYRKSTPCNKTNFDVR